MFRDKRTIANPSQTPPRRQRLYHPYPRTSPRCVQRNPRRTASPKAHRPGKLGQCLPKTRSTPATSPPGKTHTTQQPRTNERLKTRTTPAKQRRVPGKIRVSRLTQNPGHRPPESMTIWPEFCPPSVCLMPRILPHAGPPSCDLPTPNLWPNTADTAGPGRDPLPRARSSACRLS